MKRPFIIGLTGSIGMGKSTTAQMFADAGCAIWDADAAVHRIYDKGGLAVEPIRKILPNAIINGAVDREVLKNEIARNPAVLPEIEIIVHPLVAQDRADFIANSDAEIVVVDVPLLFEIGAEKTVDFVVVVSAPPDIQRKRVMARGTMDAETFATILAKQMPDSEKRQRADFVIETDMLESAAQAVREVLEIVKNRL